MTLRGVERSYHRFLAKTSQDLTALQNERQRSTDSVGVQTDPIIPNDCHDDLSITMGIPARERPSYTISETLPPTPRALSPEFSFPESPPSYHAIPPFSPTIPSDEVMSHSSGSRNSPSDESYNERYILLRVGYDLLAQSINSRDRPPSLQLDFPPRHRHRKVLYHDINLRFSTRAALEVPPNFHAQSNKRGSHCR